jgi:shikimate kinase
MGSGKTSIGKKLSKKLNIVFIDLDKEIEKKLNNSISQIFSD